MARAVCYIIEASGSFLLLTGYVAVMHPLVSAIELTGCRSVHSGHSEVSHPRTQTPSSLFILWLFPVEKPSRRIQFCCVLVGIFTVTKDRIRIFISQASLKDLSLQIIVTLPSLINTFVKV